MLKPEGEDGLRSQTDPAIRADVLAGLEVVRARSRRAGSTTGAGPNCSRRSPTCPNLLPTRTETAILETICPTMHDLVGTGRAVVEFGSGSSTKTPVVLRCVEPSAYVPIDISGDFLRESSRALAAQFPDLTVCAVRGGFLKPLTLPAAVADRPKLGFFPGSTIGNMTPAMACDLLRAMRSSLGEGAMLLIGMDRIKDPAVLVPAYDDAAA